jgi:hypothetical protein
MSPFQSMFHANTLIVSPVTPGAVAPPLFPEKGLTHGGAYVSGTATVPRVASQFGPHFTESLFAAENTTGPFVGPLGVDGVDELLSSERPKSSQTRRTAITIPRNGA